MELSTSKRNRIFWILQIVGWGSINILSVFILKDISFQFLMFSILFGTFTGVFSSSLLRFYLRKHITFERFGLPEITKVVVSGLICSALFGGLNILGGYVYAEWGTINSEVDLKILQAYNKFSLMAFSSVFNIFGWLVCYLVIKLLLKLNADRIERLELNTTLKQAQLNTLKGQINPHFMFNSLNNIRGLMLEDVEKSRDMLTKLSEMLRYSLAKNDVNAIALEEELEMVENYIDLSKIQFEDRLIFEKEIDPKSLNVFIPPMIIQLLVENAAKHGISNLKKGGVIQLKTLHEGAELLIEVRNTGKLQIDKNSTQLGLKNIRQRLRLLYADKASFSLEESNGEVLASVKIPLL